jgi:hypothetical protein
MIKGPVPAVAREGNFSTQPTHHADPESTTAQNPRTMEEGRDVEPGRLMWSRAPSPGGASPTPTLTSHGGAKLPRLRRNRL